MRLTTRTTGYWIATTLIAAETLVGGLTDLVHGRAVLVAGAPVAGIVTSLGYPVYLLTFLGLSKIPAALVVLLPGWRRLKEWAYAGIVFELAGAAASYMAHARDVGSALPIVLLLGVALLSWALRPPQRVLGRHIVGGHGTSHDAPEPRLTTGPVGQR